MLSANVCDILVKIVAGLTLADRAKILGDANIGVDEVIGVEDDILPVDLVEAYAHALLHTKIGERHVVALLGHATSGRECGDGAVERRARGFEPCALLTDRKSTRLNSSH